MRSAVVIACVLLGACAPTAGRVNIGIDLGAYPDLVAVPGYPVYYAPKVDSNFFFYGGRYWVYAQDSWYSSSWYDGPWDAVSPAHVPYFVLRVPVRYYRQPPAYFRDWAPEAPPRWGEHWGPSWAQRRSGWDQWDRASAPAPAPLPTYQRAYSGDRYPDADQQLALEAQNYHYHPRDAAARQQFQRLAVAQTPALAAAATAATPLTGAQQGQPPQPANPGVEDTRGALNRQLPAAAGLLLALSLLNGTGAVPPPAPAPAPKQPEIN